MTPPDPRTKTSHGHRDIGGVRFYSYRVGVLKHALMTEDGRLRVERANSVTGTYTASVDDEVLRGLGNKVKYFRTEQAALVMAIETRKKKDAVK